MDIRRVISFTRLFLSSKLFSFLLFFYSCYVTYNRLETQGAVLIILIICLELLLCQDTTITLLPFLLTCVFLCKCYNSFNIFIPFLPMAIPVVLCIILHFVIYPRKIKIGESFIPLCIISLVMIVGGLGTISKEDYFRPIALFYVFSLGIGMVIAYLLIKSKYMPNESSEKDKFYYGTKSKEEIFNTFAFGMYLMGLFTFFAIISYYIKDIDTVLATKKLLLFQAKNNFSTFLMFSMPFPLYYTMNSEKKRSGKSIILLSDFHIISVVLIYLGLILCRSRGGLILGSVELFVCLGFTIQMRSGRRHILYDIGGALAVITAIFMSIKLVDYFADGTNNAILDSIESRGAMIPRAFECFKENIWFGSGFGYTGNSDLYSPVKGAMNWYHVYFAQVIGSFGISGIIGFGYLIISRIKTIFIKPNVQKLILGLSYMGIFLMSMVNPGEFCPIPYELLTVMLFILAENENEYNKMTLSEGN